MGYLSDIDKVEYSAKLMKASWNKYKIRKGPNDLWYAVMDAFRKDYMFSMVMGIISSEF